MASFSMAREYLHIVPVRFTDAQLATIDETASKLRVYRSTLIRSSVLGSIATLTKQERKAADE
jgi:hypothetical protein